jgi:hypothetical protein
MAKATGRLDYVGNPKKDNDIKGNTDMMYSNDDKACDFGEDYMMELISRKRAGDLPDDFS